MTEDVTEVDNGAGYILRDGIEEAEVINEGIGRTVACGGTGGGGGRIVEEF